jgi:hypothetical protein
MARQLLEVKFTLTVEQDDIPVRGNAMASGDDDLDRQVEDEIVDRIDRGDVWAWASVCVEAHWNGFVGRDCLGGCCYTDEEDFVKNGGYYESMKSEALADLNSEIEAQYLKLKNLEV